MDRRKFLAFSGSIGVTTLAGCGGSDPESGGGGDSDGGSGGDSDGGSTSESQPTIYDIGDPFQVGSGDQSIEYVVEGVETASTGTTLIDDPDGIYAIVSMTMTNVGNDTLSLSSSPFRLIDGQDREFEVSDATIYADNGISFEELQPGLAKDGVIMFDVAPGGTYQLQIEPSGLFSGADPQLVEIGTIE